MAKTKAEMQSDWYQYHDLLAQAKKHYDQARFLDALSLALQSLPLIDGMMQYGRKYEERTFSNIDTIDCILTYAPVFFDVEALDQLDSLLKSQKRIDKNASDDIAGDVEKAREVLGQAYRIWDRLEQDAWLELEDVIQHAQAERESVMSILAIWERAGVVSRSQTADGKIRLALSTQLGAISAAKCAKCGAAVQGPKYKFLEERICPRCRTLSSFVLLTSVA